MYRWMWFGTDLRGRHFACILPHLIPDLAAHDPYNSCQIAVSFTMSDESDSDYLIESTSDDDLEELLVNEIRVKNANYLGKWLII